MDSNSKWYEETGHPKWKYKLNTLQIINTGIKPAREYHNEFLSIDRIGVLTIKGGYHWNGANCFPDIEEILYPSLVHDALYQLLDEGAIDMEDRKKADKFFYHLCLKHGMNKNLAYVVYRAVRIGGYLVLKL